MFPPTTNTISTVKFISKIWRVVKKGGLPLKPHLHALKNRHGTPNFGTVPRLPVPRLPPGGSLGTPKIFSSGATLNLGRYVYTAKIGGAVP